MTEAVLAGLFGIEAGVESLHKDVGSTGSPYGRLENVRAIGFGLPRPTIRR